MPVRLRISRSLMLAAVVSACGGGGSGQAPPPPGPDPQPETVTIRYLRVEPAYDGWGLHLWGDAIAANVATTWRAPRPFDRIENGAAVFEIPIVDRTGTLSFIAHNGDLKSPIHDLSIRPSAFGSDVWIVQDTVAALAGGAGTPFDNEADALAALAALGNASAALDLSTVMPNDVDSGLPADWTTNAGFIEIYVRGYRDSDGDGIGDFRGLISRLDYLGDLGIEGIWLMPITESADDDHGYAVEDYRGVESQYGTMADFEMLIAEAHARGIAIVIDYVINHSASTNPLFLDASTSATNDKRDWYVWSDTRPTGWNSFAGDPWRNNGNGWYYGLFSALMPDFDLRNPEVVRYHKDNLRFWLNKGVDGFRFDAVGVLFENGPGQWEDAPENHVLLGELRQLVEGYGKRFLVCEAPSVPADYAAATSCGRAFAFAAQGAILRSVRDGRLTNALAAQLGHPDADRMPLFLSNHDSFAGDRVWNQLNGDASQYRLAASTYLLAARTPFTYYGEEVGMANGAGLTGDHALRTPMSWTGDPVTAGFSTVAPFRALSANSTVYNVEAQLGDPDSLLAHYESLFAVRDNYPVIGAGTATLQSAGGDPILALARAGLSACALIVVNFDNAERAFTANTGCPGSVFDVVYGTGGAAISDGGGAVLAVIGARAVRVYHAVR